jgi:photosystem II stability/assembly factor-like uncharacterized protein
MIWDGSKIVLVGNSGYIATSSDGQTWTAQTSPDATKDFFDIAWNGSLYVIVGQDGKMYTSPSAEEGTWDLCDSKSSGNLNSITWWNGKFYSVGDGGKLVYSSNGTDWTAIAPALGSGGATLVKIKGDAQGKKNICILSRWRFI